MPVNIENVHVKPLRSEHRRGAFECSNHTIQNYCINNARKNNDAYMVRVYVACEGESLEVIGYYYLCLTSYKVGVVDEKSDAKFGRVEAVPAVYLGMIGVHSDCHRMGIGKILMKDAMLRTLQIAEIAGTYALALDALDESLVTYYRDKFGFETFKEQSGLEMFLPVTTIRAAVAASQQV